MKHPVVCSFTMTRVKQTWVGVKWKTLSTAFWRRRPHQTALVCTVACSFENQIGVWRCQIDPNLTIKLGSGAARQLIRTPYCTPTMTTQPIQRIYLHWLADRRSVCWPSSSRAFLTLLKIARVFPTVYVMQVTEISYRRARRTTTNESDLIFSYAQKLL